MLWFPAVGFAQQSEKEAITETIQLYFDGMIQRDRVKLEAAFLPEARLIGYRGETFTITSFESWASGTAAGAPRNPADYQNSIREIRVTGYTAVVETDLYWPGVYYFDYLTLIKVEDSWKIVHKTWYEERR